MSEYKKNSLSLTGAVSLGTVVIIGAGIFAILGQVAELVKVFSDILVVIVSLVIMILIFAGEKWFLSRNNNLLETQNR